MTKLMSVRQQFDLATPPPYFMFLFRLWDMIPTTVLMLCYPNGALKKEKPLLIPGNLQVI